MFKKTPLFSLLTCSSLALFIISCSEGKDSKPSTPKPKIEISPEQNAEYIAVYDNSGRPISSAKILVGHFPNEIPGNELTTGPDGRVPIPSAWTSPLPVSVWAQNYVPTTYLQQTPGLIEFSLRKNPVEPTLELRGVAQGLPLKNNDDNVDFGLMINAFQRSDLLSFDLNKVLSPQTDTLTFPGYSFQIPSNLSLPKQKEKYGIFPVTINKPEYRMYFREPGLYNVYAAKGSFSFKQVSGGFSDGKPLHELINYFKITGGSLLKINITGANNYQDFNVNELQFTQTKIFQAPAIANNQVLISVAGSELDGQIIPTDLRKLSSNEVATMNIMANLPSYNVAALKNANEFVLDQPGTDRISLYIQDFSQTKIPNLLPLVADPVLQKSKVTIEKPITKPGQFPLASLLSIKYQENGLKYWDIVSPKWEDTINLPVNFSGAVIKLEINFYASDINQTARLGRELVEKSNLMTRSSIKYNSENFFEFGDSQ